MKKDPTRDYITEAFRAYAAYGEKSEEEARGIMGERAGSCEPLLSDIAAVHETLRLLRHAGRTDIVDAVRSVYFTDASHVPRRGSFSARALAFAVDYPTSERNVYLWLREARLLCAALRGLTVSEEERERYVDKYFG